MFRSEIATPVETTAKHKPRNKRAILLTAAIVALSAIALVQTFFLVRGMRDDQGQAALPATGIVSFQSTPAGAAVTVNGQARGVTPLTLTLNPGDYSVEYHSGGVSRAVPGHRCSGYAQQSARAVRRRYRGTWRPADQQPAGRRARDRLTMCRGA